jgi:predicted alpha/beta-hydrolase family hydrolase
MTKTDLTFSTPSGAELSARLQRPDDCRGLFVLGHGSGSNMHVPLMRGLADALYGKRIATLRFQYPYSEHPSFVPFSDMPVDSDRTLIETIQAALDLANETANGVPVFVGGHSISGFTATLIASQKNLNAKAIIALAYPRKGDPSRSVHLAQIELPILIVQGTEDTLGTKSEILEMVQPLQPRVELKWVEGASHVLTVAGLDQSAVLHMAVDHISNFVDSI